MYAEIMLTMVYEQIIHCFQDKIHETKDILPQLTTQIQKIIEDSNHITIDMHSTRELLDNYFPDLPSHLTLEVSKIIKSIYVLLFASHFESTQILISRELFVERYEDLLRSQSLKTIDELWSFRNFLCLGFELISSNQNKGLLMTIALRLSGQEYDYQFTKEFNSQPYIQVYNQIYMNEQTLKNKRNETLASSILKKRKLHRSSSPQPQSEPQPEELTIDMLFEQQNLNRFTMQLSEEMQDPTLLFVCGYEESKVEEPLFKRSSSSSSSSSLAYTSASHSQSVSRSVSMNTLISHLQDLQPFYQQNQLELQRHVSYSPPLL